jgi:hypothetical protein
MFKLLGKWPILVEVLPRYAGEKNPLNLILVDAKKHFEGVVRRGRVVNVAEHIDSVNIGDVVYFKASAGFTLDGEAVDPENPLKGESHRFLKEHECIAVEVRDDRLSAV